MTAVTDPDAPTSATAPLPDRSVVPPVWSRITDLVVERGEGSWLVTTDGERYLDYTSGIGVTNTGHAHPRVVAAIQDQAAKLLHGQQNIVYHEAGLRLHDRLQHVLPGGPWSAFLSNSGAEAVEAAVKLARVATGRPGDHRVPLRVPRPHGPGDVAHRGQGRLPRRLRAAAGLGLPRVLPVLLPRLGRPARPVGVHLRLGGPARPAVPPARLPRQGGRDHRGAGHRRGRVHRPVADVPAAAARDHPHARDPADRRRDPDGLRADRRDVRRPALGRRARHRGHGQGDRLGAAAVGDPRPQGADGPPAARVARRHVRRQRRRRARPRTRRSTSSRTRASSPTPGSAAASCSAGCGASAKAGPPSATSAASASWWPSSS